MWNPENVQRLEYKSLYQALLTDHPENKLKECAVGNSPLAVRAQRDLANLKMAEALQEPDLEKRAELSLPHYLSTEGTWKILFSEQPHPICAFIAAKRVRLVWYQSSTILGSETCKPTS